MFHKLFMCVVVLAWKSVIAENVTDVGDNLVHTTFPSDFMWAASSSAFQIEGATESDGRELSVWDTFSSEGERILDGSNASVSCNSYEYYEKDIAALKFLNVSHYSMSISWSRVLPGGRVNPAGVAYYRRVFSALRAANIEPVVTLYHWDFPQALEEKGGWLNRESIDWFQEYARLCFQEFGSHVKIWITINEPFMVALYGYGTGVIAPGKKGPGTLAYQAGHNLLLAHAKAYHIYKKEFKRKQKGKVGIVNSVDWYEPESEKLSDIEATERAIQFQLGWFSEPIFSKSGDYPSMMKRRIERNSKRQGLEESRLPRFTPQEKRQLRGSADFFGLVYYSFKSIGNQVKVNVSNIHWETDRATNDESESPQVPASKADHVGLRKVLKWTKVQYNDPEIIVFDPGFGDDGELSDNARVSHLKLYVNSLLEAMRYDNVNVIGYAVRSLTDAFEWVWGYSIKFGLFHIDFNTTELERMPKESAFYYGHIVRNNGFVEDSENLKGNSAPDCFPLSVFLFTISIIFALMIQQ